MLLRSRGLTGRRLGFLAAPKDGWQRRMSSARLAEVLIPVAWHVGVGVLAGVLVAWALTVAVPCRGRGAGDSMPSAAGLSGP